MKGFSRRRPSVSQKSVSEISALTEHVLILAHKVLSELASRSPTRIVRAARIRQCRDWQAAGNKGLVVAPNCCGAGREVGKRSAPDSLSFSLPCVSLSRATSRMERRSYSTCAGIAAVCDRVRFPPGSSLDRSRSQSHGAVATTAMPGEARVHAPLPFVRRNRQ